jgi:hypothetical protein
MSRWALPQKSETVGTNESETLAYGSMTAGAALIRISLCLLCLTILVGIVVGRANVNLLTVRIIPTVVMDKIGSGLAVASVLDFAHYEQRVIPSFNVNDLLRCQRCVATGEAKSDPIYGDTVTAINVGGANAHVGVGALAHWGERENTDPAFDGCAPSGHVPAVLIPHQDNRLFARFKGMNVRAHKAEGWALHHIESLLRDLQLSIQRIGLPKIDTYLTNGHYSQSKSNDGLNVNLGEVGGVSDVTVKPSPENAAENKKYPDSKNHPSDAGNGIGMLLFPLWIASGVVAFLLLLHGLDRRGWAKAHDSCAQNVGSIPSSKID